jgi:hypothetical protein
VISPRLRFEGIDPVHWANLVDLMLPPAGGDPEPSALASGPLAMLARATSAAPRSLTAISPAMPVVVLYRGGDILRVVQLGGGVLPGSWIGEIGEIGEISQDSLRALRIRHNLPLVVALDMEAFGSLWAELQASIDLDDDLVAQQLSLIKGLRAALGKTVFVEPRLFGSVPLPSYKMLQMTLDRMLPDRRSFVFYLADGGQLWTSLIMAKRDGDVYLMATHAAIADRVRFGSIHSDARAVIKAVGERFDPVHLGIFMPLRVWHELVAGDRSAFARALAARKGVLEPAPPWFMALVGVGAVAEAATRSGRLASKVLAASKLGSRLLPGGAKAAEKLVQTLSNPLEALGLDPWDMLVWNRDWRRRIQLDRRRFARMAGASADATRRSNSKL